MERVNSLPVNVSVDGRASARQVSLWQLTVLALIPELGVQVFEAGWQLSIENYVASPLIVYCSNTLGTSKSGLFVHQK